MALLLQYINDKGEAILVKENSYFPDKSQISHDILAYLAEHPDARDSIEGIVQWWLLERKIRYHEAKVKEAVNELVAGGFIVERKKEDMNHQYGLNIDKKNEISELLKHKSEI